MNKNELTLAVSLLMYAVGLGICAWLSHKRIKQERVRADAAFNTGIEAGMKAMFEMLKESGALPAGFHMSVGVKLMGGEPDKKAVKEEAKKDDDFLKSLKIKP